MNLRQVTSWTHHRNIDVLFACLLRCLPQLQRKAFLGCPVGSTSTSFHTLCYFINSYSTHIRPLLPILTQHIPLINTNSPYIIHTHSYTHIRTHPHPHINALKLLNTYLNFIPKYDAICCTTRWCCPPNLNTCFIFLIVVSSYTLSMKLDDDVNDNAMNN